ncbi:DUF6471 domain-containing protein [Maricaulis alexandrii]|uniref:DUF6471 domain-containing protein n=1 Tax=Maricaulis alexandrii TaxID=2570354 RepID=UPI0011082C13|nr:DUF6471 domain-containing protein [Maricaulis alexandrii]
MDEAKLDLDAARAKWAKWTIFSAMKNAGLTYRDLKKRLELIGVFEDERVLRNKVARGTFSAAFFCECLAVLGVNEIQNTVIQGTRGGRSDCALRKTLENLSEGIALEDAIVDPQSLTDEDAIEYRKEVFGSTFFDKP